jgi:hypothetical protein
MPRTASDLTPAERAFLLHLQTLALRYFLDNQTVDGQILDRQHNFGAQQLGHLRSMAATGMGLIAVALAAAEPFRLIPRSEAVARIGRALVTAAERLPYILGIMPHFLDGAGTPVGKDVCSTIDSAWLVAGGLWASTFLGDAELQDHAQRLYDRIDFRHWTTPASEPVPGLIRHGADRQGRFLPHSWDRLNGETIFLYVLAAGAEDRRAWPAAGWPALRPFFGNVAGMRFISADLGLFVFQYGLDLLDLEAWRQPGGLDLAGQATLATEANFRYCRAEAERFETFRHYWGISAGDGPSDGGADHTYRCYAPGHDLDGTAHLTATLASVAHRPGLVLDNLLAARQDRRLSLLGRYGFANVNLDRRWAARDMVGIDAGAAVLALDNYLCADRVRLVFHQLPAVARGLERLGFVRTSDRVSDSAATLRRAS